MPVNNLKIPVDSRGPGTRTSWSDLDKSRLYGIGSVMYSGLTVVLHPLTVIKIRRQTGNMDLELSGSRNLRQYYRGLGVVLSLAIPARMIYVSVLEYTREFVDGSARNLIMYPPPLLPITHEQMAYLLPLVVPLSGGIAGGFAAVSSQLVVVPMDVISQRQMIMDASTHRVCGSARAVTKTIMLTEGWRGLFRGFGLSLFTSLPAGSTWWATYVGSKDQLNMMYSFPRDVNESKRFDQVWMRSVMIQVASAFNAAVVAAILTQPLDTIKTRLQVCGTSGGSFQSNTRSIILIAKELGSTSALYQGLFPRIVHMGVWGSVLSSAYEYLKVVSRKDYDTSS